MRLSLGEVTDEAGFFPPTFPSEHILGWTLRRGSRPKCWGVLIHAEPAETD
jgi:hypothetical protein